MIKIYVQGPQQDAKSFEKELNSDIKKYRSKNKNCVPQIATSCDQYGRMNVIVTYYNFIELLTDVDIPEMVKSIRKIEAEMRAEMSKNVKP